ncbi:MAG TPA: SDR family oxidoreductase [Mycobacteriales bacterium]|jgi:3-oxoacyl-[acyl-carrier protein] reductase|nr:SDR family oxidoreductase [Mycobacteriales bacterium]
MDTAQSPGTVLITGVGRRRSIGSGIALGLAKDGWDLVLNYWRPYDDRVAYERGPDDPEQIADDCRALGVRVELVAGDLSKPETPAQLVAASAEVGNLTALVMSHCESVDSSILTTSIESWDRHFAVNARATWLLIKAFADRLPVQEQTHGEVAGRIVALTSDHTAHNTPYGASKGALDRVVVAAAVELADRGVRANVINPGPIDTGWMNDDIRVSGTKQTPAGRLGTPSDVGNLVRFLLSAEGAWINGQLLYSNGGFRTTGG